MRHGIIVGVLSLAGLLSIAAGIRQVTGHSLGRPAFERHLAEVCVQAAQKTYAKSCP